MNADNFGPLLMDSFTYTCGKCTHAFSGEEEALNCPECGSQALTRLLHRRDDIKPRLSVLQKLRKTDPKLSGKRKHVQEIIDGEAPRKSGGGNVLIEQIVDRANDDYLKTVLDAATGEVIRHVREPLSKHQGRGSAKKSKR